MKISLKQLLPEDLSNETAFHLVKFVHGLSLALESIYFDQMLQHTSECGQASFSKNLSEEEEDNGDPF
jgi:hypothetical protein